MFTYEVFFSVIKKIQTEIDLLENMLMQIELDDDATFKDFLCRTSVKDFSFCQKKEEIIHYLFFWCHEEERQSKFTKNDCIKSYQQRVNCNDDKYD